MSIEDRKKHQKSVEEIREELITLMIKAGKSEETVEAVRNAKSKADLLKISSLIHDAGHPYMSLTHDDETR